jgi:DNA-binding GntR family transcriptional regulator
MLFPSLIRREQLVGEIAQSLGEAIVEGRLRFGEEMDSVSIAHRFHTSRTPVREALLILENEGLIESPARHRARVAIPSLGAVRQVYEVRMALFPMVLRELAERASTKELQTLEEILGFMREAVGAGSVEGYFWSHVRLQQKMTEFAHSPQLKQVVDSLSLRVLVLRRATIDGLHLDTGFALQERIGNACLARDPELAAGLVISGMRASLARVTARL